jgi:hypothetical protein
LSSPPRTGAARRYIYNLTALALAALAGWLYLYGISFDWLALGVAGVLALACAVSRRFPVSFGRVTIEAVDVAILAALVLLGPLWAILVAVPSMFYREKLRAVFTAATLVLQILAAGLAFGAFAEPLLSASRFDVGFVAGVVGGGFAFYALDYLVSTVLLRVKYGASPVQTLRESILPPVPSDVAAVLTALGVAYAMVAFGPAAGLVLFAGSVGAVTSLHMIWKWRNENRTLREEISHLEDERARLEEVLRSSHLEFAARIVQSLGRKDGYTASHAAARSVYAADMARELGLGADRVRQVEAAALLQDVGMVSVPDEVLLSPPERLNSLGRERLREHPVQGERILSGVPEFEEAAKWVRWHHERVDGTGYPDRLRAEWIPLEARILAVADAYVEKILGGPGRQALSALEARRELAGLADGVLDRDVVRTFLSVLDSRGGDYAAASGERFAFPGQTGRSAPAAGRSGHLRVVG